MTNQVKKDSLFQNAWFSRSYIKVPEIAQPAQPAKKRSPVQQSFEEIKEYAYRAFDQLDSNGNGFIETDELKAALENPEMGMREKSFITFLLTNQEAIAEACHEGASGVKGGISRLDIEAYFKIVLSQLENS